MRRLRTVDPTEATGVMWKGTVVRNQDCLDWRVSGCRDCRLCNRKIQGFKDDLQ